MNTIRKHPISLVLFFISVSVSWWFIENNQIPVKQAIISPINSEPSRHMTATNQNDQHSVIKITPLSTPAPVKKVNPWTPGVQHQYGLMLTNQITMISPSTNTQNTLGIAVNGTLALAVIEKNYETMVVRAELEDIRVTVDTNNSESAEKIALAAKLRTDLVTPYYLTLEPDGRIQSIRLSSKVSSNAASLIRSMAAHLQFIQPQRNKQSWEVNEQDQTGEYQAHYQKLAQGIYEKHKRAYQKIATPQGLVETSEIGDYQIASKSTFQFERDTRLKSITVAETVHATIMDNITVETQQDMELTLKDTDHVYAQIADWQYEKTQLAASKLATIAPGEDPHYKHQEKLLGDADMVTLMAELRSLDLSTASDQAVNQAMRRLTALFAVHPEAAQQALAEFKSELSLEQASILAGALASAETPQAQDALSEVALLDELESNVRNSAVALLGLSENPTGATIDTLLTLQKSEDIALSSSANLALGSVAESIAELNPEVAEDIMTSLLQDLQDSESDETLQLSLEALGNSGDSRMIPAVKTVLEEGSEDMRASGVEALRFVNTPEAVELIANTVTRDADTHVRQAAIRAMDYQSIEPFLPSLNEVARNDEDSSVRLQVVDRAGERLSTFPEGQELLAWVAENDSDSNVREHAQEYVCDFNPEACQN